MKRTITLVLLIFSIAAQMDAQVISTVKSALLFSIYPNPAIDEILVDFAADVPAEQSVVITIYNAVGDLVYNKSISLTEFQSPVKIDLKDFQRGMYVVQIISGDNKVSRKLLMK